MNRSQTEGSALRAPVENGKFTLEDYLSWPEGERWELIDGIAYDMSPAPNLQHQKISANLIIEIGTFLKGKPCRVYAAPTDVKFSDESQDLGPTVFQPDLLVICDEKKQMNKGFIKGAPELVIEIISPSTITHDEVRKKTVYEHCGVKEYWIVHPGDQYIKVYTLKEGRYGDPVFHTLVDNPVLKSEVLKDFGLDIHTIFA